MRGIVWLVLLFTVAVVAATTLGGNDGLLSVYWRGWRADISLNLAILLLLAFCAVVVLAWHAIDSLLTLPRRAGEWRALRKERLAQQALREALAEHFGGRWGRAHKAAARALQIQRDTPEMATDHEFRVLAQLLGAASLHRMQDRSGRDALLSQALNAQGVAATRADDGARLLATEWALDDRDAARAQQLLADMPAGLARRTQALRLKLQASRALRQPLAALHTAHLLANHGAFSKEAAKGLLRTLAGEALEAAHDTQQLRKVWEALEGTDRGDAFILARAATRAGQLGAAELGREWLLKPWERMGERSREEREQIALALLPNLAGLPPDWLPRIESAQAQWPNESAVQATVGMAYAERQLWGKARRVLEPVAGAGPGTLPAALRRRVWLTLAALARQEGDDAGARRCALAAAALE